MSRPASRFGQGPSAFPGGTQAWIDSGRQPLVGVNTHRYDGDEQVDVLKVDSHQVRAQQLDKLRRLRDERDQRTCAEALRRLTATAEAIARGHCRVAV